MDALTWVAPDGTETALNGLPGVRALGTQGLFMPPLELLADDVPEQAGGRFRSARVLPREVTLPVFIEGGSAESLRLTLRALARTVNPQGGDGRLRAVTPTGTSRELTGVRYAGGLEMTQATGQSGGTWQKAALVLRAFDPYWYDEAAISQIWRLESSGPFFPILPLQVSPDTVLGGQTVSNDGDVEAYPVWTVVGPATAVTLENTTTGETLTVTHTLAAGEVITIDARPGAKTVLREDGTNLYGSMDVTSSLWSLPAGLNEITVELPGASVDSYVSLMYRRRWLTP